MTKESSWLTSQSPRLHKRTTLYYGKYRYCATFYLKAADCLRTSLDPVKITKVINWNMSWQGWNRGTISVAKDQFITDGLPRLAWQQNLFDMAEILSQAVDKKICISQSWINVYTNDLAFVQTLEQTPIVQTHVSQVELAGSPDQILLKNPSDYDYRSYFRSAKITAKDRSALINYVYSQPDIRISEALGNWAKSKYNSRYLERHFFIDHNSMATTQMMNLIMPNLFRKTFKIVQDK